MAYENMQTNKNIPLYLRQVLQRTFLVQQKTSLYMVMEKYVMGEKIIILFYCFCLPSQ